MQVRAYVCRTQARVTESGVIAFKKRWRSTDLNIRVCGLMAGTGQSSEDVVDSVEPNDPWPNPDQTQLGLFFASPSDGTLSYFESRLRTPLNALVTSVDLLAADAPSLSQQELRERASSLHYRAAMVHLLAENLFSANAIANGRLPLQRQNINLDELIAEVSVAAQPILRHKQQDLEMRGQRSDATVFVDPRRVGQALINLISIVSAKVVPACNLQIAAAASEFAVCVQISADGEAMEESSLRPATRSAIAVEPPSRLEIELAQAIIQEHGGTFTANGDGPEFWFELPRS